MDFRYFIFDLDGTLLDSMGIWEQIDVEYLGRRGIVVPEDYQKAITPMETHEIAEYSIRRFGLSDTPEELVQEWRDMAGDAYRNTLQLLPFVKETITLLSERKIPMVVATSSDRAFAEAALKRNGILSMFRGIITAADVGRGKQWPDIYLKAAEMLEAAPAEIWVVEDIPEAIATAAAAGFCTIGIYSNEKAAGKAETDAAGAAEPGIKAAEKEAAEIEAIRQEESRALRLTSFRELLDRIQERKQ